MASFDNTVELERSLLHILTNSRVHLRTYGHRVKQEFFTNPERKFIFEIIEKTGTSGGLVTRNLFEYEVGARIADEEKSYFITEWNIVEGADGSEHPETLIGKLESACAGRQISTLQEEVDGLLEGGDIDEALSILKRGAISIRGVSHQDKPISELTNISKREQTLLDKKKNPQKYQGIKTGFTQFDNHTGGLYDGELTLIAGITGTGKSTLVRQLQKGIVMNNEGKNVLHIANEEYVEQVEHKFDAVFTGIPYLDFKRSELTDEEFESWKKYMQDWKHGRVFIKEVPAFTDVTLIEQAYRELEGRGIKIHAIIIDHLPNVKPIQKYFDQNDERAKAAADCKELARWLKLPVIIPTQAATVLEKAQKRGSHGDKLDVYGSKAQVHVANTFILITVRGTIDENDGKEEWARDVKWTCACKKNRDGPPFWFNARHFVETGRIEEILGEGAKGNAPDEDKAQEQLTEQDGVDVATEMVKEIAEEALKEADETLETPVDKKPKSYIEKIREKKKKKDIKSVSKCIMK